MVPAMQDDSDSSSGTLSPPSRLSPEIPARMSPSLSKLPAADQLRKLSSSSMKVDGTPPPREIPLFKFTPKGKTPNQKPGLKTPLKSRPALGIVPFSKEPQDKKIPTGQSKLEAVGRLPGNRLLGLLKSRSKVDNFHNLTVNKTGLPQLVRSQTTVQEFISANYSARLRTMSFDDETKRFKGEAVTNLGELRNESLTPYQVFTKNRTFTSNVKNLLQSNKQGIIPKKKPLSKYTPSPRKDDVAISRPVLAKPIENEQQPGDRLSSPAAAKPTEDRRQTKGQAPSPLVGMATEGRPQSEDKVSSPSIAEPTEDRRQTKEQAPSPLVAKATEDRLQSEDKVLSPVIAKPTEDRRQTKEQAPSPLVAKATEDRLQSEDKVSSPVIAKPTEDRRQTKGQAPSSLVAKATEGRPQSEDRASTPPAARVSEEMQQYQSKVLVPIVTEAIEEKQPSENKVSSPGNHRTSTRKRSFSTTTQEQQSDGILASSDKSSKIRKLSSTVPKNHTLNSSVTRARPVEIEDSVENSANKQALSGRSSPPIPSSKNEIAAHDAQKKNAKVGHDIENGKEDHIDKENKITDSVLPFSPGQVRITSQQSSGPLAGVEEKWNNALAREPHNSSFQRQALADLFSRLYQSNLLTEPGDDRCGDGSGESALSFDEEKRQDSLVEAKIVTDFGLSDDEDVISLKRPNVKPREKQHHLKGAVVLEDVAISKPVVDQRPEKEKSVSMVELHYMTETEGSSSDNEDRVQKGFAAAGNEGLPKSLASDDQATAHVTLHENSLVSRPSSAGRDHFNQDPEIERKRINRELAVKVMAALDEKPWFDRSSIVNLVEPGIAKHSPLVSHPKVSVTNNICSAKNYEHSHAYYYQQMHKKGKLEFIPLRGSLSANFHKEDESSLASLSASSEISKEEHLPESRSSEVWKSNWRSSLHGCSMFFDFPPLTNSSAHDDSRRRQIKKLRSIFESEFGAKITTELNEGIEILISCDNMKATEVIEKITNDPVETRRLSQNLRVWPLKKAYQFLENMGIDIEKWTRKSSVTKAPVIAATAEVPASKAPAVREPVAKIHITKAPSEETPVVSATKQATAETSDRRKSIETPIVKPTAVRVPVTKAFITKKQSPRAPITETSIAKSPATEEENKTAELRDITTKTLGFGTALKDGKAQIKPKIIEQPLLSQQQIDKDRTGKSDAEIVDVDIGTTDTETESNISENDTESIFNEASQALEKKDKQIEAARKLILALCQDVMKKELEITSLTGQLRDAQRQLNDKEDKLQDYASALVQSDVQLAQLAADFKERFGRS